MNIPLVPPAPQTRREFCAYACQAASLLAVGSLAACGGSPTSASGTPSTKLISVAATATGRTLSFNLDSAPALASVGSAVMVQSLLGSFLVARTAQDTFTALTATCTHEACEITGYATTISQFVCPCHGSQFTTSGAVAMGPATKSLQQYTTQFTNNVLTFTV